MAVLSQDVNVLPALPQKTVLVNYCRQLKLVCQSDVTVLKPEEFSVIPADCCSLHPHWHPKKIPFLVICYPQ